MRRHMRPEEWGFTVGFLTASAIVLIFTLVDTFWGPR